jgi:hypothetical protein
VHIKTYINRNKKSISKLFFITALMLLIVKPAYSQDFRKKLTQDSITISYKWEKEKRFKKNSPYILVLQIENHRKTKVAVSFVVLYYWKVQLHSTSDTKKYCLKPRQIIKGKRWNLAFKADFIVMEEYLDPLFTWEISRLKVEKNENCKTGLKLKLEPAYN